MGLGNSKEPSKKKSKLGIVIAFLLLAVISANIYNQLNKGPNTSNKATEDNLIIDATKFAKISSEQLVEIMGEPQSVYEWNYDSPNGNTYSTTTYSYNDEYYEFLVIDKTVVRLNINSREEKPINYTNEKAVFSMFGITPSEKMIKSADTSVALRYESITDDIDGFWVTMIDPKEKTIDTVKITYDNAYFGDLPRIAMTISEESDLQIRSQNGVKEVLKSPSTAKFPNINEWYFGKDKEKIIIQSYVDSQNSFGAIIRSEFQITFTPSGDSVTSFIFDGTEYVK